MGVNSLLKTVTRQRRGCDLNPGPSALESSTLTTRLPSHPFRPYTQKKSNRERKCADAIRTVPVSLGWPMLHCVISKIRTQRAHGPGKFSLELCPKLWIWQIQPHVVRQLRRDVLSKVRTLSVIKPTVVGQPKLTMLAAVDGRPMSLVMQFITVSVHLSVYSTCEMQLVVVAQVHLRQLIVVTFFADNVGIGREFESSCAAT